MAAFHSYNYLLARESLTDHLPDNKILVGSYHPSPRNVNTGRIDVKKMVQLLKVVQNIIKVNK